MRTPAKQTGMTQEAKLLWTISKQLEQLIALTGKMVNNTVTTTTTL
jgi:hypothetical protein